MDPYGIITGMGGIDVVNGIGAACSGGNIRTVLSPLVREVGSCATTENDTLVPAHSVTGSGWVMIAVAGFTVSAAALDVTSEPQSLCTRTL